MPSVTREVSAPEMSPLVQATRSGDDGDTASMGGAEMDALLAGERASGQPAPMTGAAPTPAPAPAAAPTPAPSRSGFGERPRISVPPAEPTVVLAPQLTAPAAPAAPPAPEPPAAPAVPPPEAVAAMQHAKTEAASPFEATRVGSSYVATRQPRVAAEPPKTLLWAGIGALVLVVTGAVVFFAARGGSSAAEGSSSSSPGGSGVAGFNSSSSPGGSGVAVFNSSSSPGKTPPAPGDPPASPGGTPPAPAAGPEAEARAALARLRDGIGTCVREVIGVLPGTSPPIPAHMATLKTTAYQSVPRDYRSPVWSCTKFRETEPQRYQIQWQLVTRPSEGRGIAWLDDDDDGRPDRAFAFRAALTGKREVELGEIGPLTPVPPVMKALE